MNVMSRVKIHLKSLTKVQNSKQKKKKKKKTTRQMNLKKRRKKRRQKGKKRRKKQKPKNRLTSLLTKLKIIKYKNFAEAEGSPTFTFLFIWLIVKFINNYNKTVVILNPLHVLHLKKSLCNLLPLLLKNGSNPIFSRTFLSDLAVRTYYIAYLVNIGFFVS
uniref:Uncharacterized protein n=2 Tax=Micrurus lemniscatus lemniscatus TaxID=129467 RepID=A0A2D4HWW7_MICLE